MDNGSQLKNDIYKGVHFYKPKLKKKKLSKKYKLRILFFKKEEHFLS
jgi:hypothetical protein